MVKPEAEVPESLDKSIELKNNKILELKDIPKNYWLFLPTFEKRQDSQEEIYGITVPLKKIKNGNVREILKEFKFLDKFYIKNNDIGLLFGELREKLHLNNHKFKNILELSKASYFKILDNKQAINLRKFICLPEELIKKMEISKGLLDWLNNYVEKLIINKNTSIKRPGLNTTLNWHENTLLKFRINNEDYAIFTLSKHNLMRYWINILKPSETYRECDQLQFPEINGIFKKFPFGIWVPKEYILEGGLSELLSKSNSLKEYYLKNPEVGVFLAEIQNKLQLSPKELCSLIEIRINEYAQLMRNDCGINIQKFVNLPEKIGNLYPLIQKLDSIDIDNIKNRIDSILLNKKTSIYKTGSEILNWQPDELISIKVDNREFLVLSTSKYETKKDWNKVLQYIKEKYKGKPPIFTDLNAQFPGLYDNLRKYFPKNTQNEFLKALEFSYNLEINYNWKYPANWDLVRDWSKGFSVVTSFFNPLWGKEGRSPNYNEIKNNFGGLYVYLKGKGIPTEEGHIPVYTHNDLLRFWGLPVNREVKYDWFDPSNWEMAKNWAWLKYIFGKERRSPTAGEFNDLFRGITSYLRKNGISGVAMKSFKYNDLLRFWKLPITDVKKAIKEGFDFDQIGKDCLDLLKQNLNLYRSPWIFHPLLKKFGKKFAEPDAITHNFKNQPLKKVGARIFLKEGERIDEFIEFKINFGCIKEKDWEFYTRLTKEFHIYLLRGYAKPIKVNGCKMIFHSRKELLSLLQNGIKTENKAKIKELIQQIHALYRGIDLDVQKSLPSYINKE